MNENKVILLKMNVIKKLFKDVCLISVTKITSMKKLSEGFTERKAEINCENNEGSSEECLQHTSA